MATKYWIGTTDTDWTTSTNWSPAGEPVSNDDVIITGSQSIAGVNKSAVKLDSLTIDHDYTGTIGSVDSYLQIGMGGTLLIQSDLSQAFIEPTFVSGGVVVNRCYRGARGAPGVYLRSPAAGTIPSFDFRGKGHISYSVASGTGTITSLAVSGGGTFVAALGTVVSLLHSHSGTTRIEGTATAVHCHGGTVKINGTQAVSTIVCDAGTVECNTSGTVTAATAEGNGLIDFTKSSTSRTVTTLTRKGYGTVRWDVSALTITNAIAGSEPHFLGPAQ